MAMAGKSIISQYFFILFYWTLFTFLLINSLTSGAYFIILVYFTLFYFILFYFIISYSLSPGEEASIQMYEDRFIEGNSIENRHPPVKNMSIL